MCDQKDQIKISDINPVIGDTTERDSIDELQGYTFILSNEKFFNESYVVLYTDVGYSVRATNDLQDTNIFYVKMYEDFDLVCTHKEEFQI